MKSVYISKLFAALSALALFIVIYKSEIVYKGNIREHYILSGSFAGFCVLFFSVLTYCKRGIRDKIIVVAVSTVIGVYLSEVLILFGASRIVDLRHQDPTFDKRSEFEVLRDLKGYNLRVAPRVLPAFFVMNNGLERGLLPLSGLSNIITVHCNESGNMVLYESDRYGFNNPDGLWEKQKYDFILIGDSFAAGDCVDQGDNLASTMRAISGEVGLSFGMGGNGPLLELATLSEYGRQLRPKIVYWLYYEGNDLHELAAEQTSSVLMSYLGGEYTQNLIDRAEEIAIKLSNWAERQFNNRDSYSIFDYIFLKSVRRLISSTVFQRTEPTIKFDGVFPLFIDIISRAKHLAEQSNSQFVFVYLPSYDRYSKPVDHNDFNKMGELIKSIRTLGVRVINVHDCFDTTGDPISLFPFRKSGHYNREGYAIAARCMSKAALEQ